MGKKNNYCIKYSLIIEIEAESEDKAIELSEGEMIEAWKEGGTLSEIFNVEVKKQ